MNQVFRFTIRRWLEVIVLVALVLGSVNRLRAYERVVSARSDYDRKFALYEQGRRNEVEMAIDSGRLKDAECSWCPSRDGRIVATRSHLRRLEWLRDQQVRQIATELHGDRGGGATLDLGELNVMLAEARSMLSVPR